MGNREESIKEQSLARDSELQEAVRVMETIQGLLDSAGWKIFEEEMMSRLQTSVSELRKAGNLQEIGRCQGSMNILESLIQYPKTLIESGNSAEEELGGK